MSSLNFDIPQSSSQSAFLPCWSLDARHPRMFRLVRQDDASPLNALSVAMRTPTR
jgi:hypothetical protein